MRKKRNNKSSIEFELMDNQNLNTPSPDVEMIYKGNDLYWNPTINKTVKSRESNTEDLLSIIV